MKTRICASLVAAALIVIYGLGIEPANAALLVGSSNTDQIMEYSHVTGAFVKVFADRTLLGGTLLNDPTGLALGPDGKIYAAYADDFNNLNSGGILRFLADGTYDGVFSTAVKNPIDLEFAPDGTLYVSSFIGGGAGTVKRLDSSGALLSTSFPGDSTRGVAILPTGGGSFDVLRTDNQQVVRTNANGSVVVATYPIPPFSHPGEFAHPLDFGPDGKLYAAMDVYQNLYVLDLPGGATSFAHLASGVASSYPSGLEFDLGGNILVNDFGGDRVRRYSTGGVFVDNLVGAGSGGLSAPSFHGILMVVPATVVPEPATVVLLAVGGMLMLGSRRL